MDLARRLRSDASRAMQRSLFFYRDSELTPAVLFAAISVEVLTKAALANTNAALVAAPRHMTSLLWFANPDNNGKPPPSSVRSVSFNQAVDILLALGLQGWPRDETAELFECRNRCVHVGSGATAAEASSAVRASLAATEVLLSSLDSDRRSHLGNLIDFADELLAQRESDIAARLNAFLVEARRRSPDLNQVERDELAKARRAELDMTRDAPHEQIVDCPVCGLPALVEGELVLTHWEGTYESKGVEEVPRGEYQGLTLRCATCQLHLKRSELLDASGVLENWELSMDDVELWREQALAEDEYLQLYG